MSAVFGDKLSLRIFGASHAPAIGFTADGFPIGGRVDMDRLSRFMQRRSAAGKSYATGRKEPDIVQFTAGIENGRIVSSPISAKIENMMQRSADYEALRDVPRPGHADYPAIRRYNGNVDLRGGGSFSGRMTAPLCIAGGIAIQLLEQRGIHVFSHILRIYNEEDTPFDPVKVGKEEQETLESSDFRTLDQKAGKRMLAVIEKAQTEGDSVGGIIECAVTGLSAGACGGALFEGLDGKIAQAIFGVPAVKGVEFGAGFACADLYGSENNDPYYADGQGNILCSTNNAGGILGGIPDGMPLIVRAAIKPTPSIYKAQESVSISRKENTVLEIKGRHDPCIVPRAAPCIESAAALAVLDALLEAEEKDGLSESLL